MGQRTRACEACQKLKAKCYTSPSGRCERCEHAGTVCVPAAPRLQRDRIAELEAKVDELNRKQIVPNTTHESPVAFIDARMPLDAQRNALAAFALQQAAVWPFLSAADTDLDHLRKSSPHLLLAILTFPANTQLSFQVQQELVFKAMSIFGEEVIAQGNRSLQMVKALLTAAFWFRQARSLVHGHCHQLLQLAVDMAMDIGIAGPQVIRSPPAYFSETDNPTSLDARKTWIACFIGSATQSLCVRRPPCVTWTPYLEESTQMLRNSECLLGEIAQIMNICNEAASLLGLCNLTVYKSVDDVGGTLIALRHRVVMWFDMLPRDVADHPILSFWKQVALVHVHEFVLHTKTNKGLFAGPYVPDKIAVTDFAAPSEPSREEVNTFRRLLDACHSAIDQFASMRPSMILGVSSLAIGPAVLHAHFVLVQAHVAVTGLGNTLSQVSTAEDVALSTSMQKLEEVGLELEEIDPSHISFTTPALQSPRWLRTWLNDYEAIVQRYKANTNN